MSNATRVVTGVVRLSYANIWEPKAIKDSKPKYSASLIIPKSDVQTVRAIEAAVNAALTEGTAKFGGKIPPRGSLKLPLRDGDTDRDDEAYQGAYFVNANSTRQPGVVDQQVQPILDQEQVYSGCYVRAAIGFYAFNNNGNRGVACSLDSIQLVRDGERLGAARPTPEQDFTAINAEAAEWAGQTGGGLLD